MAGTVAIGPDRRWSASTWLFDWVVEYLAAAVSEPVLADELRQIVGDNLGWLGLADYGRDAERELWGLIRTRLVGGADAAFSESMVNRSEALAHLQRLAHEVEANSAST